MPMDGALVNIRRHLFDELERTGRVAFDVDLAGSHGDKVGDTVDVVCDDDARECEATITLLENKEGGETLIELTMTPASR